MKYLVWLQKTRVVGEQGTKVVYFSFPPIGHHQGHGAVV